MPEELIPVNIIIGDRNYRIKILPSDEEIVRKTLKLINDKIVEFRSQFAGKDMQDYISMVLIWFATQPREEKGSTLSSNDFLEGLQRINKQFDALTAHGL